MDHNLPNFFATLSVCKMENDLKKMSIFYQKKVQFADQARPKTYPWSIEVTRRTDNFDQKVTHDADDGNPYRLTPCPMKARNI